MSGDTETDPISDIWGICRKVRRTPLTAAERARKYRLKIARSRNDIEASQDKRPPLTPAERARRYRERKRLRKAMNEPPLTDEKRPRKYRVQRRDEIGQLPATATLAAPPENEFQSYSSDTNHTNNFVPAAAGSTHQNDPFLNGQELSSRVDTRSTAVFEASLPQQQQHTNNLHSVTHGIDPASMPLRLINDITLVPKPSTSHSPLTYESIKVNVTTQESLLGQSHRTPDNAPLVTFEIIEFDDTTCIKDEPASPASSHRSSPALQDNAFISQDQLDSTPVAHTLQNDTTALPNTMNKSQIPFPQSPQTFDIKQEPDICLSSTPTTILPKEEPNHVPNRHLSPEPPINVVATASPYLSSSSSSDSSTNPLRRIQPTAISNQQQHMFTTGRPELKNDDRGRELLLVDGYIPNRLPLRKTDEITMKKIKRRMMNRLAAHESRERKRQHMNTLESKVQQLWAENAVYQARIQSLEEANASLKDELSRVKAVLNKLLAEGKS